MSYRVTYSDYSTTTSGPPDPERWVGPPGPPGATGPQGPQGEQGTPGAGGTGAVNSVAGKAGDVILIHTDISDWTAATASLGAVQSVAGKVGAVTLIHTDITDWTSATAALGAVQSVAGKTGDVTLTHGDITDWTAATASLVPTFANIVAGLGYTPYDAANPSGYQTASQVAASIAAPGFQTAPQVSSAIGAYAVPLAQLGAVSGVATLDATGKVPTTQLPGAVTGTLTYLGGWNASTNTPTLASGALSGGTLQAAGRYYLVTVTGTTSVDGVASWTAGDWVSSNGTIWQRVQNSTSPYLPLTGGAMSAPATVTAIGGLTLTSNDSIAPASNPPDFAWSLRDTAGNLAVGLDLAGVFNAASLAAPIANVTTLTNTTGTVTTLTSTTATIANEQIADRAMPDLIGAVQGSNGNVVSGYDAITGEFNVASLSVQSGLKIAGNQLSLSKAPSDALDVTAAPFSAKGDATESFCYGTISGTSLTIVGYTGNITLTQIDAATARLVITAVYNSGIAFQGYDVGRTLYLVAGSYTLQAVVTRFWDATTVDLAAASITPQSAVSATVTWPCFLATDIGKYMVIDGAGQFQMFLNAATRTGDPSPYAIPFITTIAAVVSPTQVTLTVAPPVTAWTSRPTRLRWGSNDTAAIVAAGQAAYAQQKRKLYFPGDGSLYLLLGLVTSSVSYPTTYGFTASTEAAAAVNGLLWLGDNSRVFACDIGGQTMPHTIAQVGSDTGKTVAKKIFGRASFPRCSKLQTINLLIMGDSQSVYGPQNQFQAVGQAHHFAYYFRQANPGKTINVYNTGIGGSTFESIDANPVITNTNLPAVDGWVVPRPIAGTTSLMAFVANINRSATSATNPIVPDCVAILDNGGNDGQGISVPAMRSVINQILAVAHADGNGPTDVVMMTDNLAVMGVSGGGNGLGTALPGVGPGRWGDDYAAGIIRTMAANSGYGCIDLAGAVQRTCYGMDETTRRLRVTPQWTVTGSPTAPITLPHRTVNYSFQWVPTAASDAAAWAAMQEIRFGLSQQIGNDAIIRLGPNGHLWTATETAGMRVPTTCTIGAGSTSLTVAAPTTFSGITFSTKNPTPIVYVSSGPIFTAGMVPSMMTIPTGTGNRTQRDFIRQFIDGSNVMRLFNNYGNGEAVNQSGTITVGGAHFYANDGTSCPDVVIFYPDGTIFQTRVAYGGYVSQTQVTLVNPAPQALAGVTVPVFIGRMGEPWTDSGFDTTGRTTGVGTYSVDVQRDAVLFSYGAPGKTLEAPIIGNLTGVERYGGSYHPVIVPTNSQEIAMKSIYIDTHRPFLPSATPWEIRGQNAAPSQSYWLGGISGHPASPIMADIQIPFYANQDLGTV